MFDRRAQKDVQLYYRRESREGHGSRQGKLHSVGEFCALNLFCEYVAKSGGKFHQIVATFWQSSINLTISVNLAGK